MQHLVVYLPEGTLVRHQTRGEGEVVECMDDGRTKVRYENGEEHRYKPTSIYKLTMVSPEDEKGNQAATNARNAYLYEIYRRAKEFYPVQAIVSGAADTCLTLPTSSGP